MSKEPLEVNISWLCGKTALFISETQSINHVFRFWKKGAKNKNICILYRKGKFTDRYLSKIPCKYDEIKDRLILKQTSLCVYETKNKELLGIIKFDLNKYMKAGVFQNQNFDAKL